MKKLICYGAMALVVGVAATISGQSEGSNSSSGSGYVQFSKIVGRKVKSSDGREIGIVKDVVIDRSNGCMAYTVVSIGGEGTGIRNGGGKILALPWAVYSPTPDLSVLTVNVNRDKVYNAPPFDDTRMDEYARPDYINNIYSYYGVSTGPHTAVTAGTDVTGTAGATASPGEVAAPDAVGTGSPNKKTSVPAHGSSAVNSDGASRANPSRKAIRSARPIARPSTDRDETESSVTTENAPLEDATSPTENKRSRHKAVEDTSARRPRATPESAEEQD